MIVCVISDLHIGAKKQFDTFKWEADDFMKILDFVRLKYKAEKIILNGDVYDLYQNPFQDIKAANPELINYFKQEHFIYIRGNHDISVLSSLASYDTENSYGQKLHFEHGHLADFLNGTTIGRYVGRSSFKILKKIMHWKFVEKTFMQAVKYNDKVDQVPRKYDSYKYLSYALKLLQKYDLIVFGHTHKLEEHKTYYLNTKKIYINSGSCSLGRFQCIILDTESLKFETIKWGKKKVAKTLAEIKETQKKGSSIKESSLKS